MTAQEIRRKLEGAGIENAEWETTLLLERFCMQKSERRSLLWEEDYTQKELLDAVERRTLHEPLQYIFGEWEFYRQSYLVSPDCLIPRPDTERLVEEAVRRLPENGSFLDLCTGSGCIAISTLAERQDLTGYALDISEPALKIAKENAKRNGVADRLTFLQADLLKEGEKLADILSSVDGILSNPPYIESEVVSSLSEEVKHEPVLALDGGKDGMIFYRELIRLAKKYMKKDALCLFEIGYDQAEKVSETATEAALICKILKDYGGNDRVAVITR